MNHPRTTGLRLVAAVCASSALVMASGCGKKGPPLPPLNRVPAAPADFAAIRRANRVDIRLTIPDANTDGTRPANISRVEVYAYSGPAEITDDQIWRLGTRLATFAVKTPRDQNDTIEPGDPVADLEPLEGPGLDQGTIVGAHDDLTIGAPSAGGPVERLYVSVGIAPNGRKGLLSKRGRVPLTPAPAAPAAASLTYDEKNITVAWEPMAPAALPAGVTFAGYHVYDASPRQSAADTSVPAPPAQPPSDAPLTKTPVAEPRFLDPRVEWGATRCYAVRGVESVNGVPVESAPSRDTCVTLVDTFAPAPPKGLSVLPSSGGTAMQLIWDANTEPDLAGYIVLRGVAPGDTLAAVTPSPVTEPSFTDTVQPGTRYVYAIQAVDKSGNRSAASERKEETAR